MPKLLIPALLCFENVKCALRVLDYKGEDLVVYGDPPEAKEIAGEFNLDLVQVKDNRTYSRRSWRVTGGGTFVWGMREEIPKSKAKEGKS